MPRITVCRFSDLTIGKMKAFTVGTEKLVLYHLSDGFFATQANCTHVFAPLARGKLQDDCTVRCPFHRATFDIRTGKVVEWANFPPGVQLLNIVRGKKALKTYTVSLQGDQVVVDVPAS